MKSWSRLYFVAIAAIVMAATAALWLSRTMPQGQAAARDDAAFDVPAWRSPLLRDHPLTGRVWDVAAGQFVPVETALAVMAARDHVLLGEIHDNPDHHALQAFIIRALVAAGRKPGIVLEMVSADQAGTLSRYLARPDATAAGLGPALDWEARGWPAWAMYQPIAEAALAAGLPMFRGDADVGSIRAVSQQGFSALGDARTKTLALAEDLPGPLAADLRVELAESHCNLVPDAALAPMGLVQRYRDAHLAEAMVLATTDGGAVLIAGGGHARTDRGVPYYHAAIASALGQTPPTTATVIFVEVAEGATAPSDYGPRSPEGQIAADFLWFTPRAERPDPCEQMRAFMRKKKG